MNRWLLFMVCWTHPILCQVVPTPRHVSSADGHEVQGAVIQCSEPAQRAVAEALAEALRRLGVPATMQQAPGHLDTIRIVQGKVAGPESYEISSRDGHLLVTAESPVGAAHATATLLQLVDVRQQTAVWPSVAIRDSPDRSFRCFMVDMGRNPHPPELLRQVVDMCWFYKVNYLQLHLSDDQLFSWPSRAFPKLHSSSAGWTWEEFEALESYSQARGVTIIPEIDVPGHSTILRREYPEVFGQTPTDLASAPEAKEGLETLLRELLSVFPSTPFVHLGGDEAYGVPNDVQRAFINHLSRFVESQGKRAIVWEGPPLGTGSDKVDTRVIHMNWNTAIPAQEMVDAGYDVINASWDPLYVVDHYPRTMFTAVDVQRCYAWDIRSFAQVDPGFPTFHRPHQTRDEGRLLGFCMPWWEGRPENLLPLCLPRLAAVASAAWNRQGEQSFETFEARQERLIPRLAAISGFSLPPLPFAPAESQATNLAYRARVTVSSGSSQSWLGPDRLTNGITDRFDHFLGYPTQPKPLEIVVALVRPATVSRVVVHETAVGQSYEVYDLYGSEDGVDYSLLGTSKEGSRRSDPFVTHRWEPRPLRYLKIVTQGCHGLTFPSFSRLTEITAFEE